MQRRPLTNKPEKSTVLEIGKDYVGFAMQKILVLEDDIDFAEALRDFLESIPYEVVTVTNGADGLREVLVSNFQIIICDMMMPTLPGDMFYRAVERVKPELCPRFIFITGHRANPKIDWFFNLIDATILPKPFHMAELRQTIDFVLKQVRLAEMRGPIPKAALHRLGKLSQAPKAPGR